MPEGRGLGRGGAGLCMAVGLQTMGRGGKAAGSYSFVSVWPMRDFTWKTWVVSVMS